MTTARPPASTVRTVVLRIPALSEDSYVGSGCCVISAEDVIRAELESWPGVVEVDLDVVSGVATMHVHDGTNDSDLAATVEALGYPAEIVSEPYQSQQRR